MIRPELWGWSSIPLSTYAWGWDDAETVPNVLSGIPRFVFDQTLCKTVYNAPKVLTVIHGAYIPKTITKTFVPRTVMDDSLFKLTHSIFTMKAVNSESQAARAVIEDRAIVARYSGAYQIGTISNVGRIIAPGSVSAKVIG